jgi:cytosolic iron-sulfur protein assembly protein CIAO1
VYSLSWSRGRIGLGWLASAGSDGKINVWEVKEVWFYGFYAQINPQKKLQDESSSLKATLVSCYENAHGTHDINSLGWCPQIGSEDILASGGDDGVVRIWRIPIA